VERNQLYINEILIPLLPDSVIALSFQINNIASTKDIRGNNSNTFTIKANAQTNHALGFANLATSSTKIPYRQLPARYLQNGIDLLKGGGYAVVQEYRDYEKEFDVELYSGNLDFFALIDGKTISQLNLSAYNHLWNADVMVASFANTAGYIYSLIDYGTLLETGNELRADRLFPSVYQHTLINQIFFEAGFEVEGKILSNIRHRSIILPFVNGKPAIADNFSKDRSFRVGPASNDIVFYSGNEEGDKDIPLGDDSTVRLNFFQGIQGNYNKSTGHYTVDQDCLADASASVAYRGDITLGDVKLGLKLLINDITIVNIQHTESFSLTSPPGRTGTLTLSAENLTLHTGDVVRLVTNIDAGGTTSYQFDFFLQREAGVGGPFTAAFWSMTVKDELPFGALWKVAINLPDMSQTDLLKNWAQTFGLIFQTNSNSRTVSVRQFEEIAGNASLTKDFSSKLVTSRTARQTWRLDYAQKNLLAYKDDNDVVVTNANGSILIDDRNLEVSKELFTMDFAATKMMSRLNHLQFAWIPLFENFTNSGTAEPRILVMDRQDVSTGLRLAPDAVSVVKFETGTGPDEYLITTDRPHGFVTDDLISIRGAKVVAYNRSDVAVFVENVYQFRMGIPGGAVWTLNSDELGSVYAYSNPLVINTALPIPYFILSGKSFNLGFADNLIEKNYGRLVTMLNPLLVEEAYFKLNEVDIQELDQFIPVWVQAYGAYFFLQQIKDFVSNSLTRCILIRL